MMYAACWALIYIARALEMTRLYWNTLWFEWAPWSSDRTFRFHTSRPGSGVHFQTTTGRMIECVFAWCHPLSVSLTLLANRGLPPLGPDDGCLTRLHARK